MNKLQTGTAEMTAAAPAGGDWAAALHGAREKAMAVSRTGEFDAFVEMIRARFPWRFERLSSTVLDRDYLHVVDHHLEHLIPRLRQYVGPRTRRVLDFGCGSGGSSIPLAMVYPAVECRGTDIDADEIAVAGERAKLYGVADRCDFSHIAAGERLPFPDESFDLCLCSSVLEYVTDEEARRFCVREMVRLIAPGGLIHFSAPNGLYPFEIHSWWRGEPKWGWNYFPKLLHADTVDYTAWEVRRLARPAKLTLYRTPFIELLKPWSSFCLRREL